MNFILFDDKDRDYLLPLTYVRPSALIRCGILTMAEKWQKSLNGQVSFFTAQYLRKKYPYISKGDAIFINGTIFPDDSLLKAILSLSESQVIFSNNTKEIIAFYATEDFVNSLFEKNINFISENDISEMEIMRYFEKYTKIKRPWDIFSMNGYAIKQDFEILTAGRKSAKISPTNCCAKTENIFIEENAVVEFSTINASGGPVYIGKNTEIMENSAIRGPFALCENSAIKMGSKIYGPTTIGPHCKVGGEVNNSVFFGYSNKAHDGFLGNSVIAEWCNIGAGTNNSNLKNTYDIVRLWSYPDKSFVSTGLQFCGLIMGDHSKCAINTMFNTGTVAGVNSNIFGSGFPRNFIPSFSWGGANQMKKYNFDKAIQVAKAVFERRNVILSDIDIEILKIISEMSE